MLIVVLMLFDIIGEVHTIEARVMTINLTGQRSAPYSPP